MFMSDPVAHSERQRAFKQFLNWFYSIISIIMTLRYKNYIFVCSTPSDRTFAYDPCPYISFSPIDYLHGLGWWEGAGLRSGPNVFTEVPRFAGFLPFQVFSTSCKFSLGLRLFLYSHQTFVFELMSLNSTGDFSFDVNVLLREKLREKTRPAHNHLCCIDLPLDWWRSLNLFTFCQPFKWLWQEEELSRVPEMWKDW